MPTLSQTFLAHRLSARHRAQRRRSASGSLVRFDEVRRCARESVGVIPEQSEAAIARPADEPPHALAASGGSASAMSGTAGVVVVDVQLAVNGPADHTARHLRGLVLLAGDAVATESLHVGRLSSTVGAPSGVAALEPARAFSKQGERLAAIVASCTSGPSSLGSGGGLLAGAGAVLATVVAFGHFAAAECARRALLCPPFRLNLASLAPLLIVSIAPAASLVATLAVRE